MADSVSGNLAVRRVARGGITAFAFQVIGIALTYCSQLLIARIVGVATYGVYAYVFAWMVVLAYLSALGFDVALLRFIPAYEAERAWSLLRGVSQYAERRAIFVGIFAIGIGVLVVTRVATALSPELRNTFLVGFTLIPVWALLWIRCATVRAFGGVASAVFPDRIMRDGLLLGLVALLCFGLKWSIDAPLVMAAALISSLAGLCVASLAMRRIYPSAAKVIPSYDAATWRRVALPLVIIGATEALMNRTGVLLLGWMGDTRDAGIYGLVFNIAFVAALPRTAINTLFAPAISALFVQKKQAMLKELIAKSASWTLCAAAGIAIVLSALADPLLRWFGEGYELGVMALRILLLGQAVAACAGSQLYVLMMTGHERRAAKLLVSSALANTFLSFAMIGMIGLTGAAIAATLTLTSLNLLIAFFVYRYLGILPGVFARWHTFRIPVSVG
jgi:O-antigen/teichoic acid export membrane protein